MEQCSQCNNLKGALKEERSRRQKLAMELRSKDRAYQAVFQALQTMSNKNIKALTKAVRFAVMMRDNFTCRYCGASPEGGASLEIDHVVPVTAGGSNEMDNLRTACRECNAGKRDQILAMDRSVALREAGPVQTGKGNAAMFPHKQDDASDLRVCE